MNEMFVYVGCIKNIKPIYKHRSKTTHSNCMIINLILYTATAKISLIGNSHRKYRLNTCRRALRVHKHRDGSRRFCYMYKPLWGTLNV